MREIEHQLLRRAKEGKLELDEENEVLYWHGGHHRWKHKVPDTDARGRARYRFGPRRDTVYKNRLVWLIYFQQEIPDGYVVDHRDGNRFNDHPQNLRLMCGRESLEQGNDFQEARRAERLGRWFDFIAVHGREPQTMSEESYVEVGF